MNAAEEPSLPGRVRVSVIIPAYNAEVTLAATIRSALLQRTPLIDVEIIVVNDGSTDHTAGVIAGFGAECRSVTIPNSGVSAARSAGLQLARGSYIQYLDSDDLLAAGKIARQCAAMQASGADVAYGDWERVRETAGSLEVTATERRVLSGDAVIAIFLGFWCPPAALLFSREITCRLSWNRDLPVIQDARYLLDAAMAGATFIYTPGVQAHYRVGGASLSTRDPLAFVRDCFENTRQLHHLWQPELAANPTRKDALLRSLRYCITEFSYRDPVLFKKAVSLLLEISPGYIPPEPGLNRFFSRLLGFRNAEKIAAVKRRLSL